MQGPQLFAEPGHFCKLDVATSRIAFLDLNLNVQKLRTLCSTKLHLWHPLVTISFGKLFISFADLEKSILFEVTCMDIEHICVTFEMSQERGMQSFEMDFSDLRNVHSIMHKMSSSTADALTDVVAKAVFDR